MRVLFICSTDLSDRSEMAEKALDVQGVVNVREMLSGEDNLHVEVVAEATSDVKESTEQLDALGLRLVSSNILADNMSSPGITSTRKLPVNPTRCRRASPLGNNLRQYCVIGSTVDDLSVALDCHRWFCLGKSTDRHPPH